MTLHRACEQEPSGAASLTNRPRAGGLFRVRADSALYGGGDIEPRGGQLMDARRKLALVLQIAAALFAIGTVWWWALFGLRAHVIFAAAMTAFALLIAAASLLPEQSVRRQAARELRGKITERGQ